MGEGPCGWASASAIRGLAIDVCAKVVKLELTRRPFIRSQCAGQRGGRRSHMVVRQCYTGWIEPCGTKCVHAAESSASSPGLITPAMKGGAASSQGHGGWRIPAAPRQRARARTPSGDGARERRARRVRGGELAKERVGRVRRAGVRGRGTAPAYVVS